MNFQSVTNSCPHAGIPSGEKPGIPMKPCFFNHSTVPKECKGQKGKRQNSKKKEKEGNAARLCGAPHIIYMFPALPILTTSKMATPCAHEQGVETASVKLFYRKSHRIHAKATASPSYKIPCASQKIFLTISNRMA